MIDVYEGCKGHDGEFTWEYSSLSAEMPVTLVHVGVRHERPYVPFVSTVKCGDDFNPVRVLTAMLN